jgi:hypothetical protein
VKHPLRLACLLSFLLACGLCAAQVLKPNPAQRKVADAPDIAQLHSQILRGSLTPDERYFVAEAMRHCAVLRGFDPLGRPNRPPRFVPEQMPAGPQRDVLMATLKSCVWFTQSPSELAAEADRVKADAVRAGSVPALGRSLNDMVMAGQSRKAADLALDVLESRDAEAIANLITYMYADEAHSRMRDDPTPDPRLFSEAWESFACANGADCGRGSFRGQGRCLYHARCAEATYEDYLRAIHTPAELARISKYRAFIEDVFAKRQWDRLGIRATRYPTVEGTNQRPPLRGR